MIVLGLESSGQCGSVAIVNEGNLIAFDQHSEANAHAERLLALVDSVMQIARCSRQDISRIAVGTGPGNFTGLRVGISLACGLGMGLNIPVVGVSSLAAMAHAVNLPDCRVKVIVRDARKEELFCAVYDKLNREVLAPFLIRQIEAQEKIDRVVGEYVSPEEPWALAGDGLRGLHLQQAILLGARIKQYAEMLQPDANHIAILGMQKHFEDWPVPEYVREVDAVLPFLCKNPAIESDFRSKHQSPVN